MRDRYGYTVHFCSEEVYDFGNNDLLFDLLIEEIVGHDTVLSDEEKDDYSVFGFFTVLDLPPSTASDPDIAEAYRTATVRLQIDFETGFPGKFPSRTSGIQVSATGDEQGSISDL